MDSTTNLDARINIDQVIDSNPIGSLQWRVVSLCFVLAMIDGFDAQSIAYVAPLLVEEFGLATSTMGQLISSALIGLMAGALIGTPIADRIGRKPIIIISVALMGLFSVLTATADTTQELFLFRIATGLGLGALIPTVNILTAEFAPAKHRALLMTAMFVGLPIGTIVGGVASAGLIKMYGWESVFIVGGVLPILMIPVIIFALPESPRFLALKSTKGEALCSLINQIVPSTGATPESKFESAVPKESKGGIGALFTSNRTPITLLLWLVCFANLLTIYAIIGWLPSVLTAAGFPLERAILTTVLFSLGGVLGGLTIAVCIDRFGATLTMTTSFILAAVAVALVGQFTGSLTLLLITLFLAGATAMGSQFGLNAMASASYDTNSRATGLGWALAVGRMGAIIGPIVVGAALALELSLSFLFFLGAVPLLIASGAAFVLGKLTNTRL